MSAPAYFSYDPHSCYELYTETWPMLIFILLLLISLRFILKYRWVYTLTKAVHQHSGPILPSVMETEIVWDWKAIGNASAKQGLGIVIRDQNNARKAMLGLTNRVLMTLLMMLLLSAVTWVFVTTLLENAAVDLDLRYELLKISTGRM